MRVGLIADSHIPAAQPHMPVEVARAFEGVDLILHAGDIYVPEVLDFLSEIAPVHAVPGDGVDHHMDSDPRMKQTHVLTLDGVMVGLLHILLLRPMHSEIWPGQIASGFPKTHSIRKSTHDWLGAPVDVVVFGDTHYEMVEEHEGILFVNPGSPTMVKQVMKMGSVAMLELTPDGAEARIIPLASIPAPA
ncbi:MAG: YfcE family phosphodiesterase [Chloroflexi bacterium]|nr:YfcE family phosphodiesterase [Chloroflexota bacterium]